MTPGAYIAMVATLPKKEDAIMTTSNDAAGQKPDLGAQPPGEANSIQDRLEFGGLTRRGLIGSGIAGTMLGAAEPVLAARDAGRIAHAIGRVGRVHELPSSDRTVKVGAMDPHTPVVLEIESGDIVHYPNTWVNWANEAKYGVPFGEREAIRKRHPDGPYSLIGPVAVKGAEPGDVIECRMIRLRPIDWGWNSTPLGVGALTTDFDTPYLRYVRMDPARRYAQFASGVRIPLAPIQGVMAVQPAGDKPVSAILSGSWGGNISLRNLVEGTSLFLGVEVPGGRLWTGDSHAAAGDGVVDQTAIETAMEDLRIQYILHKRVAVKMPLAETPNEWIVLAYGETVDDALQNAIRKMMDWLAPVTGLTRADIYALASIAGSFRFTQYANWRHSVYTSSPLKAVHGVLPKNIFSPAILARISESVRPKP